ncbi:hypothetical protein CGMCC3_g17258 [Colletotrichum fructicola]|nr:uncharacterized protein CGMCC3_g17258 [Colletotrichum fructicola]KAE9566578.1 hypothetical protein CGMCC3_g17258 [Colletotrichum fructicola]
MQEILQHGNDINDSPGTGGFTGENASARHPPIHGIICSLGIRLSQKLLSFEDLAGMFLISSENNFAFSDMSFLRHHSGPWKPLSDLYSSELYQPLENQVLGVEEVWLSLERFVYFMKSFTLTVTGEVGDATSQENNMAGTSSGSESLTNGLQFEREALSITGTSGRRISLLERRYSTMLAMTPHSHPIGNFRLFSIMDTAGSSDWDFYYPIHEFNWKESGINPAGQMTGVAALQVQVFVFIRSWDKDWTETLDELSTVVSVMPKSIENDSELEELMYDPQLKKTKTYFKALQILRIFSDIIEEADIQVESLSHQQIRTQGQQAFRRENLVLNYNWTVVKSIHKEASTNGLLSTSVG